MIGYTTPQAAGISQQAIDSFLKELKRREINMHSLILARGNNIFYERYWAPFTADTPHRMYSVTKSFVSIAVGCLIDEGKIALDDPIVKYFPDKQPTEVSPWMQKQTIRHMLMMSTCLAGVNWFQPGVVDRTAYYFAQKPVKPAGSLFDYDSTGSYILGALVERVSGMTLLDYLKKKILNRIGGFDNAHILEVPDGVAWGDSAMICTSHALLNFARFVMNLGTWDGERLLSEDYLRDATRQQTNNDLSGCNHYNTQGYGYQIWMNEQNGFSFHGMGGQHAICIPEKDFILVCTGDNQYNPLYAEILYRAVFDYLIPDEEPFEDTDHDLAVAHGAADSALVAKVNGVEYVCDENPMGITHFHLEFDGGEGAFVYENAQGLKRLPFGLKKNWFGKFPQFGYSDERGNVHEITDFLYDCASSAGWVEENKLQIRVQIIDRYFGSVIMTFGFTDDGDVGVRMVKVAEDFLDEYQGWIAARPEN